MDDSGPSTIDLFLAHSTSFSFKFSGDSNVNESTAYSTVLIVSLLSSSCIETYTTNASVTPRHRSTSHKKRSWTCYPIPSWIIFKCQSPVPQIFYPTCSRLRCHSHIMMHGSLYLSSQCPASIQMTTNLILPGCF